VELLTELAAVLLTAGISAPEFERSSKVAFVKAASRVARLGNARLNKSAVAAMTGLSRAEVKRLAGADLVAREGSRDRQRALRVLDGWQADPEFLDSSGLPRPLSLQDGNGEFSELVRRYSGDIPPRAILRELNRLELVTSAQKIIQVRKADPDSRPLRQLQTLVAALGPILSGLSLSRPVPAKIVARDLVLRVPDMRAHRLLHKQVNEAVRSFFVSLQSAADGASLPRKPRAPSGKNTRICVLISE
jgi:hypothetical protein